MKKDLMKEKIITPLLKQKPNNVDLDDYLSIIFNLHSRIITTYYVHTGFNIPGFYLENDAIPIQGVPAQRRVKRNDYIVVRVDDNDPSSINIEHRGQLFLLNRLEWNLIRDNMRVPVGGGEEI